MTEEPTIDCAPVDLNKLLEARREIAHIWGIEDVLDVRPDLTDDQAWEVLKLCGDQLDSEFGLTWDSIDRAATQLYPQSDETSGGSHD